MKIKLETSRATVFFIVFSTLVHRFPKKLYFSKCFKKEFGIFPKEYAEKLKNVN